MFRKTTKKPSSRNAKAKENHLNATLQQAELKQTQEFLKNRKEEIDREIRESQSRLNISYDLVQPSHSNLLFSRTTPEIRSDKIVPRKMSPLDSRQNDTNHRYQQLDKETLYNKHDVECQGMLRRLKKGIEDTGKTPFQVTEYFLPSSEAREHPTTIPLSELVGVFEVDLLIRLTRSEESLIMTYYGDSSQDIQIKELLQDLGFFDTKPTSSNGQSSRGVLREIDKFDDDLDADLPMKFRNRDRVSNGVTSPYNTHSKSLLDTSSYRHDRQHRDRYGRQVEPLGQHTLRTTQIHSAHSNEAHHAALNRSALAEIHALVKDSLPADSDPTASLTDEIPLDVADEDDDEVLLATLRQEVELEKQQSSKHHLPYRDERALGSPQKSKTIEQVAVENVATSLAIENARLKQELSAFDRDFFEELEDLKYKYAKLQSVVGEDDEKTSTVTGKVNSEKVSTAEVSREKMSELNPTGNDSRYNHTSLRPEEVGRLGRSAKLSLKEMERGGLMHTSNSARHSYPGQFVLSDSHMPDSYLDRPSHVNYGHDRASHRYSSRSPERRLRSDREGHRDFYDRNARHESSSRVDYIDSRRHDVNTHSGIALNRSRNLTASLALGLQTFPDNYSGLCERRLVFELQNHVDPAKATNAIIHRVISVAQTRQCNGFVTPDQLHIIMREIGIDMSMREVELLAQGFASNGRGGIDAREFCLAIQTMMYNATDDDALVKEGNISKAVRSIVWNIARDVLMHKNYSKLLKLRDGFSIKKDSHQFEKMEVEVFDSISKPFLHMDENENGILTVRGFSKIVNHFSGGLPDDELYVLIEYLKTEEDNDRSLPYTEDMHHHQHAPIRAVYYKEFISLLVDAILEMLVDDKINIKATTDRPVDDMDTLDPLSSAPWLLREFDFVDCLLCQLENQSNTNRRKMLIQLQSMLVSQAEGAEVGEGGSVDGIAVLKALVTVGFQIPRELRVHFLQQVERMAGLFNYVDLCKVLMSSCLDWSCNERMLMAKILKAMGTTTSQRRLWLNRLRKDLELAAAEFKAAKETYATISHNHSGTSSWQKLLGEEANETGDLLQNHAGQEEPGLTASTFLHCLRQSGVNLSVDEEATLLDCLDFELHAREAMHSQARENLVGGALVGAPMIRYSSFVSLCARHVGKWYQSSPEVNEHLKNVILGMRESDVPLAIREFQTMLQAFDESHSGSITFRPFLVACRRSRLMSKLDTPVADELAKVLSEEGGGSVKYYPFVMHLRSLHHQMRKLRAVNKTIVDGTKAETYDILNQLTKNCSDPDDGTFRPLRFFLVDKVLHAARNKPAASGLGGSVNAEFELSHRDVSELLREFNIVYNPEDLESFKEDVNASSSIRDYFAETPNCPLHLHAEAALTPRRVSNGIMNARDIIHCLQQLRPAWPKRNPRLAMRIKKMLSRASTDLVEKMILRIKAFSRAEFMQESAVAAGDDDGDEYIFGDRDDGDGTPKASKNISFHDAFAPKEVFSRVLKRCGLPLTDDDIYFLCDESDPHPQAGFVRISVLLEAMCESEDTSGVKHQLEGISIALQQHERENQHTTRSRTNRRPIETTDKTLFAMEHLKILLWNSAEKLKRNPSEWVSDVTSLLNGFDRGGGVCTPEDFILSMRLLSVHISDDIMAGIPRVANSVDLIPFKQILDIVLDLYNMDRHTFSPPRPHRNHTHSQERRDNHSPDYEETGRFRTMPRHLSEKSHNGVTKWEGGKPLKTGMTYQDLEKSAVRTLVDIVRRRLNIFIGEQRDTEQAWASLLTVFGQFDPNGDHVVTPRDFCLAVSVLMDNDSPVLTKQEWEDIILFFQDAAVTNREKDRNSHFTYSQNSVRNGMVNYLAFLDLVLDSSELSQRTGKRRGKSPSSTSRSHLGSDGYRRGMHHSSSYTPVEEVRKKPASSASQYASVKPISFHAKAETNGLTSRLKGANTPSRKKFHVSYGPDQFSNEYYEEDEDNYQESSTISGRGVVGASYSDISKRNRRAKVNMPRTHERYDEPRASANTRTRYDQEFGTVHGDPISSIGNGPSLTPAQYQFISGLDTIAVKELNSELSEVLAAKLSSCPGRSMKELLKQYLIAEDKDRSGTLILHNVKAVLQSLGIAYHFLAQPNQKALLEELAKRGKNGLVVISDFLKIIYLS